MKPANVLQLEIAEAFASTRGTLMRLGMAALLGLPFVLAAMPARARVAGLVMIVLFTGFFGSAVATTRRRSDGRWTRLRMLPIARSTVIADTALAGMIVDLLQAAPILLLFGMIHGGAGLTLRAAFICAGTLIGVLALLNVLGICLGLIIRSNAEVHLAGALAVGALAFLSGIIPMPGHLESWLRPLQAWNPIAAWARSLAAIGGGASAAGTPDTWMAAICAAAAALLIARRSLGPSDGSD